MKKIKIKSKRFAWKGANKRGKRVSGEMKAMCLAQVKVELHRQGIVPLTIRKKTLFFPKKFFQKITSREIAIFSRQLATLLSSGVPLVQSFEFIHLGETSAAMQKMIEHLKSDVEAGNTFSEALHKRSRYFNDLYCGLIRAGEQSGSLDIMLTKIAAYREKMESLKAKIKKALFYPTAVVIVAILVTTALLVFVIPQFELLFSNFGAELPALTKSVINASNFFQEYGWLLLGFLVFVLCGVMEAKKRSEQANYIIDRYMLHLPILGVIVRKAILARFARTLAITFAAGLPLMDALETVASATGNLLYTDTILNIRDALKTGQSLQALMSSVSLFPPMMVKMIAIGEETGNLEKMLTKIADIYEEEVDNAVDGLSSLLEPFIMVVLGSLIGFLVIAMYLPIFKIGAIIH